MEKPLRILAVDNEPTVTLSLGYVFTAPRYHVTTVKSGQEALAELDANPGSFDVIIVDQKMPNLTGTELVAAMRERGVTSKVIALSAFLSDEIRATYEGMGVSMMFAKPFDVVELRTAVDCRNA